MSKSNGHEDEFSEIERAELRSWLQERRDMKAQARLLLLFGMAIAGVATWLGFDRAREIVHRVLN